MKKRDNKRDAVRRKKYAHRERHGHNTSEDLHEETPETDC